MYEWTPDDEEYPSENNDFNHYQETIEEYEQRKYEEFYEEDEDED